MARKIDFSKPLSAEDAQYVAERPWLLVEAAQAGFEVSYESDDPADEPPATTSESEEESDEDKTEDVESEDEDEDDEEPEDYSDTQAWTKATLQAEIDRRNEEYDEDEQIVPTGSKRQDLVDALLADDEALAESDEDETEE